MTRSDDDTWTSRPVSARPRWRGLDWPAGTVVYEIDMPWVLRYDNAGRPDCVGWFTGRGWTARSVHSRAESARPGRHVRVPDDDHGFFSAFVTAELPG